MKIVGLGCSSLVKCVLSMREDLGLNPSTALKKTQNSPLANGFTLLERVRQLGLW